MFASQGQAAGAGAVSEAPSVRPPARRGCESRPPEERDERVAKRRSIFSRRSLPEPVQATSNGRLQGRHVRPGHRSDQALRSGVRRCAGHSPLPAPPDAEEASSDRHRRPDEALFACRTAAGWRRARESRVARPLPPWICVEPCFESRAANPARGKVASVSPGQLAQAQPHRGCTTARPRRCTAPAIRVSRSGRAARHRTAGPHPRGSRTHPRGSCQRTH